MNVMSPSIVEICSRATRRCIRQAEAPHRNPRLLLNRGEPGCVAIQLAFAVQSLDVSALEEIHVRLVARAAIRVNFLLVPDV